MFQNYYNKFSKYDTLPTDQLEEILRLDALTTKTSETDFDSLLYIMGVLAGRDTVIPSKNAHEAWSSFLQHWLPFAIDHFTPALFRIGTSQYLPQ
jgi:hypothetical protein